MAEVRYLSGGGQRLLAVAGLVVACLASGGGAPAEAQIDGGGVTAMFVPRFADDVPGPARNAVDAALAIWSRRVLSSVPIEIDILWRQLPRYVAGASDPISYEQTGPDGAFDPAALANAVSGYDHSPSTSDIRVTLASGEPWHYGEGQAPPGLTDMESFVLHEVGHGLGLTGSFVANGRGALGWGRADAATGLPRPVGMDRLLMNGATRELLTSDAFVNPSGELMAAATSRDVVWGGRARDARGNPIAVFSPDRFDQHSSLTHLDDDAYPVGDADSLMTSFIKRGEAIRRIGPAALGVLADLGWQVVHERATSQTPRPHRARPAAARPVVTTPAIAPTTSARPPPSPPTTRPALETAPIAHEGAVAQWPLAVPATAVAAAASLGWTRRRRSGARPAGSHYEIEALQRCPAGVERAGRERTR